MCDHCPVRNRAICSVLNSEEIAVLSSIGRCIKLSSGKTLFWEGEDPILVANVVEGVLKISTGTEDGREQIVGMVYPSDFIGNLFGAANSQSVTALTDASVCIFPRREFEQFAREHPALEHKLLERTMAELERTRRWMLLLVHKTALEKVASFLLEMAERTVEVSCQIHFALPGRKLTLPFKRQQIADLLGLSIETVSRQFTRLKQQQLIDLPSRREVIILDFDGLTAEAG